MSQKVSSILFNNYIYNNSKWFSKNNSKYLLNEDLQIREIINLIFKSNINKQFLFVDKVVIYKYYTKVKIYIYFFCNFNYFKQNIYSTKLNITKSYLTLSFLYYKYIEILQIKKLEIIKLLRNILNSNINIHIFFKNVNYTYNNINCINNYLNTTNILLRNSQISNIFIKTKTFTNNFKYLKNSNNKYSLNFSYNKLQKKNYKLLSHTSTRISRRFTNIKYFKTLRYLLYVLAYNTNFSNKLTITSLLNLIYYELNNLDNTAKNYNFLFYNLFNIIREQLMFYFKDDNCKIKGIRIQVKGRFFLTKRKRIFIFNLGDLNLNKIDYSKDYACLDLIKSTGSSSLKIWISYKN